MSAPDSALAAAGAVRSGETTARALLEDALRRIEAEDGRLNCFTRVLADRARARADAVDRLVAAGGDAGPLAGVPFAVKDLFDVAGIPTTAGSKAREAAGPALQDAAAIARLEAAGAVLIGTLNMDEFAYGFSTENAHYGVTHNPHDLERLAGGSSGGSAAAVAAGLVQLTLGSDTNGSIRVPASLCGVFGLRPTHGAASEAGVFPFVERLDVIGPFARSVEDVRAAFELMSGQTCAAHQGPIRAARLTGWFHDNADDDARESVAAVCAGLGAAETVELGLAAAGRSAGFLLTASEGGHRHLAGLRQDATAFDHATRSRFVAGALVPDNFLAEAEEVAARFISQFEQAIAGWDILVAPSTPAPAPRIDDGMIVVNGQRLPARANLGLCAQPISLTGAPVLSVPVKRTGRLPLGVQLIATRGREQVLFAAAARLVEMSVVACEWPAMAGAA